MQTANLKLLLSPWLRLARISALPTAISNIMLGYLLAYQLQGTEWSTIELLVLISSSSAIYLAGMILNDVFDIETDRVERPYRPLPASEIKIETARRVGYLLLLIGVGLAPLASVLTQWDDWTNISRRLSVAVVLASLVIAYNGRLKPTVWSPIVMGGCRCFNLLLGASAVATDQHAHFLWFGFAPAVWYLAGCLGVYVAGISWLARQEAEKRALVAGVIFGGIVMMLGVAGFAIASRVEFLNLADNANLAVVFPLIVGLIGLPLLRRLVAAWMIMSGDSLQAVVILALRTIIVFDAVLCLLIAPDFPQYALLVVGLLVPAVVLGRWLKST